MPFFSALKSKLTATFMGQLLAEVGSAPADRNGRMLTITIRQRANQPPHLNVKSAQGGNAEHMEITCSRELADLLEKTAHEIRKQLSSKRT